MKLEIPVDMHNECRSLALQIERRYGSPMFRKMHGESSKYAEDCAVGFLRSNTSVIEIQNLRSWLMQGLKPFAEYPPNLEMMIQIGRIVKICPPTPRQSEMADFWYRLDAVFSQGYGRFWRMESPIEELPRERVWLSEFEKLDASVDELVAALESIQNSAVFRSYPPTLEQFKGALLSLRKGGAPLVEDAWLMALSIRPGQPLHPLIVKARSKISAFDLNQHGKIRENEQRFKIAYLTLLRSAEPVEALCSIDDDLLVQTPVEEYASTDTLIDALKGLGR